MTEAQHQVNVIKWSQQPSIRSKYPELALLHHIPNGGKRDEIEAKHLSQAGTKRGVPDLHLPVARGKYHSIYIEMKADRGRVSDAQKWWGDRLRKEGNFWSVCYGWKEATGLLEWYLEGADEDAAI